MGEWEPLYAEARDAIRAGKDPQLVTQRFQEMTGMSFQAAARINASRIRREADEEITDEQRHLSATGRGAGWGQGARDMITMLANDATFGFADEAVGLVAPEAGARMREDVDALRAEAPMSAQILTGVAGGLMMPGMAVARAAPKLGLLGATAAGVGAGAAQGALQDIGEGEGSLSDRADVGTLISAGIGGLTGGALGAGVRTAGRAVRGWIGGSPGQRLGRDIADAAGDASPANHPNRFRAWAGEPPPAEFRPRSSVTMQQLQDEAADKGQEAFATLRRKYGGNRRAPFVIRSEIEEIAQSPYANMVIRDPGVRTGTQRITFDRIAEIQRNLKRLADNENNPLAPAARRHLDLIEVEMESAYPGYKQATIDYARAMEPPETYAMAYTGSHGEGRSVLRDIAGWGTDEQLSRAIGQFGNNPPAQDAIRRGLRDRLVDDLVNGDATAPQRLRDLLDGDVGVRRYFREMFGPEGEQGDLAFERFMQAVQREGGDLAVRNQLKSLAQGAITAFAFGGAAGLAAGGRNVIQYGMD